MLPYGLEAWEQRKSDDDLFAAIVNDVLKRFGATQPQNREEWNDLKRHLKFRHRPIYALGFWNVLSSYLSGEGYLYLQDLNGYDSNTMNWSAGEAMQAQIGDFGADTCYHTFQEGFDALAHGSADRFCAAGGKIWSENGLVTFGLETGGDQPRLKLQLFNKTYNQYWNVYARSVVLAMPRRSLELLDQTNFFFNDRGRPQAQQLGPYVQSVIIQPAFKLYLGYGRPWWWRCWARRSAPGRPCGRETTPRRKGRPITWRRNGWNRSRTPMTC